MSRYRYLVLALLAVSIIMNVVLLMFLAGGRQAATVEQVPAEKNLAVETYKITEDTVMSGGSLPQYQSVEELPASLRQRIERLYAAKGRRFTALDTIIESFSVKELTIPEAVAKLCNDHTVICGIETVPWPSTSQDPVLRKLKRFSVSFEKVSPRQILESLVAKDPAFLWVEEGGVANVVPSKAYNSPSYPLNKKIPQFRVEGRPFTMVFGGKYDPALFSLPEVQGFPIGGSGRWPREFEPQVSVHAQDKSVREIINEVARQVGMAWSLTSCVQRNGEDLALFEMHPHVSLPDCSAGEPDVNEVLPSISFEEEVHDFGELGINEVGQCEFKFVNIGHGFNVIDSTIIKDGGRYMMFLKDETLNPPQKNIRLATASAAEGLYSEPSQPITGEYWAEGPTAVKIADTWLVYFDKYRERSYGLVISKDLKNWTDVSDKLEFPQGSRHGTILQVSSRILDKLIGKK